jgi:hypothetical protein
VLREWLVDSGFLTLYSNAIVDSSTEGKSVDASWKRTSSPASD